MSYQEPCSLENPKKIRVCMLTTDSQICGTEQIILSLLRHINTNKFEPTLVSLFGPGDLIDAANLQVREKGWRQGLWRWKHFVQEQQPHLIQSLLIHSNLLGRITRLFRRDIALLSGISTVYTVEGYGRFYAWLERYTHFMDSLYVVNSALGEKKVLELIGLPEKKLELIHNGIELSDETEKEYFHTYDEVRQEFDLEKNHLVIGLVAQFRPAKRHDLLIRAVAQLQNKYPSLRLMLIGAGDREQALKDLAEEVGVKGKTIFTGYRTDARRLLHGLDIFALPSDVEGEPISLMEAMDASLPVVAAKTGGIPEIVVEGKTGYLHEPGDVDGLVHGLDLLLDSSMTRQNMGSAGRARLVEHFSAKRMTREFQLVYEKCFSMRVL